MITLENEQLTIQINEFGAELQSVVDKQSGYEFMWQADEEYWGRHAPVLFPIVGRLKDNQFKYEGQTYEMTQHGFARDSQFKVVETAEDSVTFLLRDSEDTLKKYPFAFELYIQYVLEKNRVDVKYKVKNPSDSDELYYAVGGHPAFNMSQKEEKGELEFDEVSVELLPEKEYRHLPLSTDGLIKAKEAQSEKVGEIDLTHETFNNDALIYEINEDTEIVLKDEANQVQIQFQPQNMKYVGIWSPYPKRAGFICIEPWAGIADTEDTSGNYDEKLGINQLAPGQAGVHGYGITFKKD